MLDWSLKDQTTNSNISHPFCFLITDNCEISSCPLFWVCDVNPNSSRANLTSYCAKARGTVAISLTDGVTSVGIGGAGKVGGVGVGILTDTAELDTDAPGTYSRVSPLPPLPLGVSGDLFGATAPACGWICVVGVRGGVKGCLGRGGMPALDAEATRRISKRFAGHTLLFLGIRRSSWSNSS